jgi:hypothetical protein
VDRDLVALSGNHHDHLEQVRRGVRPDDEPTVWVVSGIFGCERMVDRMDDVFVGDAVPARLLVNLHPFIVIRKVPQLDTHRDPNAKEREPDLGIPSLDVQQRDGLPPADAFIRSRVAGLLREQSHARIVERTPDVVDFKPDYLVVQLQPAV